MTCSVPSLDDIDEIGELYTTVWLDTYPNKNHGITIDDVRTLHATSDAPEMVEKRRQKYAQIFSDPNMYFKVVRLENKIVGVAGGEKKEDTVHLKSLYVLPEYQGQGVGTALMDDFLMWAGDKTDVTVHVAVYNAKAIAFYEHKGFVDTGKRFSEERFRMKSGSIIPEMEMILKRET